MLFLSDVFHLCGMKLAVYHQWGVCCVKLLVNCLGNTLMHLKWLESSWFAQIFNTQNVPILQLMRFFF